MNIKPYAVIILDRDGIINYDSPHYIKSVEEWHPIPGAIKAISQWSTSGYKIAIASNQSGIGKGLMTQKTVDSIHAKLSHEINKAGGSIDYITYCPHAPHERCECRKPNTKMISTILRHFQIEGHQACFIGDKWSDRMTAHNSDLHFFYIASNQAHSLEFINY
tara:strand:- start:430 stop:918 length:489 start_codon:yes stop_codon:yes gene_type:complete